MDTSGNDTKVSERTLMMKLNEINEGINKRGRIHGWAGAVVSWAGAVVSWVGAVMSWAGAVMSWAGAVMSGAQAVKAVCTLKVKA